MFLKFFKEHSYLKFEIRYDAFLKGWMTTVCDTRNDKKWTHIIRDINLNTGLEDFETAIMILIIRTFGEEEGSEDD